MYTWPNANRRSLSPNKECRCAIKLKNCYTGTFKGQNLSQFSLLQALLAHPKAKILLHETDRYGNTPLHIASEKGYNHIVKVCKLISLLCFARNIIKNFSCAAQKSWPLKIPANMGLYRQMSNFSPQCQLQLPVSQNRSVRLVPCFVGVYHICILISNAFHCVFMKQCKGHFVQFFAWLDSIHV